LLPAVTNGYNCLSLSTSNSFSKWEQHFGAKQLRYTTSPWSYTDLIVGVVTCFAGTFPHRKPPFLRPYPIVTASNFTVGIIYLPSIQSRVNHPV
jgi:hypothetical protein